VSGYYKAFNKDTSRTGIVFRFFDAAGQPVSSTEPTRLARVDITVRATSAVGVLLDTDQKNAADSTKVSATLRNDP
jgi:hypothetical protein